METSILSNFQLNADSFRTLAMACQLALRLPWRCSVASVVDGVGYSLLKVIGLRLSRVQATRQSHNGKGLILKREIRAQVGPFAYAMTEAIQH